MRGDACRPFTRDEYAAAVEKLMAFAGSGRERDARAGALACVFDMLAERFDGPDELPRWVFPVLDGFIAYGARDGDGKTAVERFLAARGRDLPPGEIAALVALSRARASLFEVDDVQIGAGLVLRDCLHDDVVRVREVSATASSGRATSCSPG